MNDEYGTMPRIPLPCTRGNENAIKIHLLKLASYVMILDYFVTQFAYLLLFYGPLFMSEAGMGEW